MEDTETDVDALILQNLWKNHRLIPPTSSFAKNWFTFIILLVLYNAVYIPIELCFEQQLTKAAAHIAIDFCVDGIFLIDIMLNFRTVYYDENQELVLDKARIRQNYMAGWFWLDLFASLPYDVVGYVAGESGDLGALGLLKLPRLLRLGRLLKKMDQLAAATAVRVLYIIFTFVLIAHWLACLWWLIGMAEWRGWEEEGGGKDAMVRTDFGVPWPARVPGAPLSPDSPFGLAYFSSLYWSLTVLAKAPWVGPDTVAEKVFMCFTVAVGAIFFAILLTFVSSLARQSQSAGAAKRDTLSKVSSFAKWSGVSKHDAVRLTTHADTYYELTAGLNDNKVLAQLPVQMRAEVVKSMHSETLRISSLFRSLTEECTVQMLTRMQTELIMKHEVLIAPSQNVERVYMLMRGALSLTVDEDTPLFASIKAFEAPAAAGGSPSPNSGPARRSKFDGFTGSPSTLSTTSGIARVVQQTLEKPGACLGGYGLGSKDAAGGPVLYPVRVVATRKSICLSIPTRELMAILNVFGEPDRAACLAHLDLEHARLMTSLKPQAMQKADESRRTQEAAESQATLKAAEAAAAEDPGAIEKRKQKELQVRLEHLEGTGEHLQAKLRHLASTLEVVPQIMDMLVRANAVVVPRPPAIPSAKAGRMEQ